MKLNRILTFIIALIFILNTGVAFATTEDYDLGYKAGLSDGKDNKDSEITVRAALREHKESNGYPEDDIEDPLDYDEGYYDGYEDGLKEEVKADYATELGEILGGIYAYRDFQEGKKANWEKSLPSDREIRDMFNLNMETSDYREIFIDAFKISFIEGYLIGYEEALLEPSKITLEQGIEDGEELGGLLGATFGTKDYYENRKLDFTRNLPSDRVITTDYSLNNDSDEYKDGFLSGFVRAYEEAYNEAYREVNINDTLRDEEDAISHGQEIGINSGSTQATLDFMSKLTNDWRRSLPSEEFLILEYSLTYQSPNYRDGFLAGYFDGYSEGYNLKFKELSQGLGVDKSISEIIPIKGGSLLSLDGAFNVAIQQGTYYHPVNLTIHTTYDGSLPISSSLIKASDSYKVSILNTSNNLVDKNLIEISYEYYGDKLKGGIYKLVDNRWMYIPTIIEDGVIKAYIKPSSIKSTGNTYSVFVDNKALLFPDSRGHWAKDEINTYVRRGIIYGYTDMTFKPEKNISRAEFLSLLSRIYNWNLPIYTANTNSFKDFNTFGGRNSIISYALGAGYIKGYDDSTFKPNDTISYKEIEIIMGRVLNNTFFRWNNISTKMLHEEKVRSTSLDNINNKITRAEVVYMLYNITENKF